ncbi:MAG: phosphopantothenoylcysteine decarboxylase [Phycisphaerales bacterium]
MNLQDRDNPEACCAGNGGGRRLLITAGPTHEPIDAVRYLANRSSGRLGVELANAAADVGWSVTLLLGPVGDATRAAVDTRARTIGFRSTADLEHLLAEHLTDADVLVMAAAVADYRPALAARPGPGAGGAGRVGEVGGKIRREKKNITLELEPTPDLLAGCASRRSPGQLLVGFALEPRERLMESAREKLARKRVDLIVANPLETMDASSIEATLIGSPSIGASPDGIVAQTGGPIEKSAFAPWLLRQIDRARAARCAGGQAVS